MLVGRRKCIPMAIILNMVTARVTDADKPAIIAKHHIITTNRTIVISLPYLNRFKGFKAKLRSNNIKATCKPETARICTAPASV